MEHSSRLPWKHLYILSHAPYIYHPGLTSDVALTHHLSADYRLHEAPQLETKSETTGGAVSHVVNITLSLPVLELKTEIRLRNNSGRKKKKKDPETLITG